MSQILRHYPQEASAGSALNKAILLRGEFNKFVELGV